MLAIYVDDKVRDCAEEKKYILIIKIIKCWSQNFNVRQDRTHGHGLHEQQHIAQGVSAASRHVSLTSKTLNVAEF